MIITQEMESFILDNYKTKTQKEIAKELGSNVKPHNIQNWLAKNDLITPKRIFSQKDIDYIVENYSKMKYSEIGNILGFTERQIRGKVNGLGLTKIRKFNDLYFQKIDTSNKAYFVGFVFADGWVTHNETNSNYEFGLEVQSKDKYILNKLNQELGNVHNIYTKSPKEVLIKGVLGRRGESCVLRIYSKQIVEDLIKLNIIPNKTKYSNFPKIENELFFDFLRGYIDGDGCYYIKNNKLRSITIICSHKEPLSWIQDCLKEYEITTSIYKENDTKYKLYCFREKDMQKLLNYLYANKELCLMRKYEKIKSFL